MWEKAHNELNASDVTFTELQEYVKLRSTVRAVNIGALIAVSYGAVRFWIMAEPARQTFLTAMALFGLITSAISTIIVSLREGKRAPRIDISPVMNCAENVNEN